MGLFKTYSEKEVKRVRPIVEKINSLEPEIQKLSDEELRNKTAEFKDRLAKGETLDDILPEAFAVVREASKRVLGMRHFDVQLIGGIILHQGRIAEMKTGEGKTLVATLPVYLNALTGKGVHVVTVNDYLAKRDSEWMGKVYKFLGLTVGLVISGMDPSAKKAAYAADVTYGTNNEFGFDYLRDNMVIYKDQLVQRELNYAIVDEIDSILIDEARTPLIISGRGAQSSDLYKKADSFVARLTPKVIVEEDIKDEEQAEDNENYDYIVDLKAKSATLTDKGIKKAEAEFGLENFNDLDNSELVHNVNQALKAHGVMKKDIDYIVKNGEVLIVDEFTGRIMYGRRYNNGLHQAIEAKEHVKIADESKTLATITFQNYFRMYDKLSGMTGTAMTEEAEFQEIYKLDVIEIPTNKPMVRDDHHDIIYKNENAKYRAVISDIKESFAKGQPVLVGTVSIEKSEKLSSMLKKEGIKHQVLNAKFHEKEAEIIAQAGKFGTVTIATNMAGRGTDIMLGGNSEYLAKQEMRKFGYSEDQIEQATAFNETDDQEVLASRNKFKELKAKYDNEIKDEKEKVISAGGLKIIGTERHESRRIDNQLRGRSGRQGDPGSSVFFISLEDDLAVRFGGEKMQSIANFFKVDENTPFQLKILSRQIEKAQKRIEAQNYAARRTVLQFDDVMNRQRELIYSERNKVLDGEDVHQQILDMFPDIVVPLVREYVDDDKNSFEWDVKALNTALEDKLLPKGTNFVTAEMVEETDVDELTEKILTEINERYDKKIVDAEELGFNFRDFERFVLLRVVDTLWMDHIDQMSIMKNEVGLRAYGQHDPIVVFKREGFDLFDTMIEKIRTDTASMLLNVEVENIRVNNPAPKPQIVVQSESGASKPSSQLSSEKVTGRNSLCPCGSGKKYKNCCGKNS